MLKSHGQDYLVGNKLSKADILLVELLYHVEELDPSAIASFPLLQVTYCMAFLVADFNSHLTAGVLG